MSTVIRIGAAALFVAGALVGRAEAKNEGQADLDKATDTRLTASTLCDLAEVIRLLESAREKGLDEGNAQFGKQLLASTRIQRGLNVSQTIFGHSPPDPRWPQYRRLALGDLERALQINPNHTKALLAVAQLNLLPGGDLDRASKALDDVVRLSDDDPELRSQALVLRAAVADDADKKLADLGKAIEADPKNVTALRARAALLTDRGKDEAALRDLDAAIELDPDHAPTHLDRAVVLIQLERYDDALAGLERAHELAPESAIPWSRRAQVLGLQGKFDEALEALDQAFVLEPGNLGVLLLRASVLQELDQTDKALADVDRVLQIEPDLAPAIQLRVRLLAGSGKFGEAISQLEKLQEASPKDVAVALQLAMFYNAEDRPRKAIEIYTQILADAPDNGMALHGRGDAQLAIGRHAPAIADYEKAIKHLPDSPGLLNNFAWVLATSPNDKLRDGKRAIELATKACELTDYKMAHILSTLASAYAETGDFQTAKKWSEKAVELCDEEQKEQLAEELESYRQKKPWRERQNTPERKEEPAKERPSDQPPKKGKADESPAKKSQVQKS